MLAYTYLKKGKFALVEKPKPTLIEPTDAIVRVTMSSICSSDLHIKHGSVPRAVPGITVGHEMVGVVEEVGAEVTHVKPGDRVTVNVETFCGECFFCKNGYVNNCTDPNGGWALGCRIDGGQTEYVRVPLANQGLNRIPDSVTDEQALLVGDVLAYGDSWSREILPNVHYHQNKVVRIEDTDFILSTLWSHISPRDEYFVSRGMNDFRQILYGGRRFTTDDFNVEHEKCLAFIKQSVSESDAKHIVVVTHHLPTFEVVAPQHKGSLLNSAFATELGDFIADSLIDVWIFGHSHANIDTTIGNTRIVSNQMGYVYYGEHLQDFKGDKFVEL